MKNRNSVAWIVCAAVLWLGASSLAHAASGLVINAAEIGIGKFHRLDNKVHPYGEPNAWNAYIISENASETPLVTDNKDGSITIIFSNLEELLNTSVDQAKIRGVKIAQLNLNAHGMPGGTWFPKSAAQRESLECADWVTASRAQDQENYDQYYSPIPKSAISQMRQISKQTSGHFGCVTGLPEWREISAKVPAFKAALTGDFQLHFLSCLVGLGPRGDAFTRGLAEVLLSGTQARVQTALNYGLGDWSMPEGMGFWDYQDDAQLARDNKMYPVERRDRTQMQKGTIRVAALQAGQAGMQSVSGLIENVDFMLLTKDTRAITRAAARAEAQLMTLAPMPKAVRLPGTGVTVRLVK